MKFSIRELLLVTVIAALAVGWWLDHGRLAAVNTQQLEWLRFYETQGYARPSGFAVPPGRVPGS